jgi:4-amino-4-deoxy-L-arabinose transferase-like glycosyltransferase
MGADGSGANGGLRRKPALGALAVAVLALIATVPSLFVRDLWNGEEIRLTEGAREMVVLGDWRAPRLNGEVVPDRPPLPYWATTLLWKAGAGPLSARLLSALSAAALLLACYLAVAGPFGRRPGLLTAAIVLTTATVFWHARTGGATPLFAFLAAAAVLAGHRAVHAGGGRAFAWWVAAYAAMGLAVLAGGVLGMLLPASTLAIYSAASGTGWRPRLQYHLPGMALFFAIADVWVAACGSAIGGAPGAMAALTADLDGLWRTVRGGEFVSSATGGGWALFPWIVIGPAAVAGALRERRGLALLSVAWLAVLAVPVLLAGGADYSYAMPAAAPLGILCATALLPERDGSALEGAMKRLTGTALVLMAVLTAGVLLVGLADLAGLSYLIVGQSYVCPVTLQPYSPVALAAALPFAALALALLLRGVFRRPPTGLGRSVCLVSAVLLVGIAGDLFLSPVADAYLSARPFADLVSREVGGDAELYLFRKDYDGVYNLYTGRVRIPVIESGEELTAALADEHSYVICDEKRLRKARLLDALEDRKVAGGNVAGRYMMLLRGGPQ